MTNLYDDPHCAILDQLLTALRSDSANIGLAQVRRGLAKPIDRFGPERAS